MKPLIILTGPTAAGKSELSVRLAKAVGGEIISADSMQIYRGMDIGTAKITKDEMQGIPHYMIDELEPEEDFHVMYFKKRAAACIEDICSRGKLPILVGGTGFYIQALLYDVCFDEKEEDSAFRERLNQRCLNEPPGLLYEELKAKDPVSAQQIHPNNIKRVIRALEYYELTGTPISEHNEEQHLRPSPYHYAYYVLTDERARLYERINARVDRMIADGLEDEVRALKAKGCTRSMVSMQGIGYKEMLAYLDGEYSLPFAADLIKKETRHFAKRQLTWFRREAADARKQQEGLGVCFIDRNEFAHNNDKMLGHLLWDLRQRAIIS